MRAPPHFPALLFSPKATTGRPVFEHLTRTERPSYGHFLKRGEITWPEYWSVDVPSRIHTCYTGVSSWMTMGVAGIRPDPAHPGYRSFLIQPVVGGDLDFAEGQTESLYGDISSRWERTDAGLELAVTIPPNRQATVGLPTFGTISASSKPTRKAVTTTSSSMMCG
jgi:alpha-L-rhamnosidase